MAAFFRGLILFLFGAIVGAAGILFFTPSFNVVVSRSSGAAKPIELAAAPAPVAPPVAAKPAEPAVAVATPKAAPVAVAPVAAPAPAAESAAEPAIDFKSVAEHLILWPNTVTVKSATTVTVMADGKKVQDLALEAGTVLQLSKVLADGTLEVRAKGAKFEIKSTLTDFSVELGKRVSDLVAKGTKVDASMIGSAPVASAPAAAPVASAAAPASTAAPSAPVTVATIATTAIPSGKLTLAQRVDVLFGNKPEAPATPAAPAAPAAATSAAPAAAATPMAPVAAPAAEAAPAASAEPKAAEKGKDLDRKMNQLFK